MRCVLIILALVVSFQVLYSIPETENKSTTSASPLDQIQSNEACIGCKQPGRGPEGPTGPRGPTGPQGPTGTCPANFLSVYTKTSNTVDPGANIIFDSLAIPVQGTAMSYDPTTGLVTFNQTGFYEFIYGASIEIDNNGLFEVQVSPGGDINGTEYNIVQVLNMSTLSGIIQVNTVGTTLGIFNGNLTEAILLTAFFTVDMNAAPTLAYLIVKQLH
jgi:hypothetical protein